MIKTFEAYLIPKKRVCWLVPSRNLDEFAGALVHINMPDDEIAFWTTVRYKQVSNYNRILLFLDNDGVWTWSPSQFTGDETEDKGEVIPTEEDIEEWKFRKTLNKYNI